MRAWLAGLCLVASTLVIALGPVDANRANRAQLEQLRGIGPPLADRILVAREAGPFKDWADLMARVKGIREAKARQLSQAGLTVDGVPFDSPANE